MYTHIRFFRNNLTYEMLYFLHAFEKKRLFWRDNNLKKKFPREFSTQKNLNKCLKMFFHAFDFKYFWKVARLARDCLFENSPRKKYLNSF